MDIYESSKFFFVILKVLGLASFSFENETRHFIVKFHDILILSLSLAIFFGIFSVQFFIIFFDSNTITDGSNYGSESIALDKLWAALSIVQNFLIVLAVIYNFLKRKNIERFMKSIFEFDKMLGQLQWQHKVKQFKPLIAVGIFAAPLVVYSTYTLLTADDYAEFWLFSSGNSIIIVVHEFNLFLSAQFILSVCCIIFRLHSLSRNFNDLMITEDDDLKVLKLDPAKEKLVLRNISILYDKLADALDEINSVFSMQVKIIIDRIIFRFIKNFSN